MTADPAVQMRKKELVREAKITLKAIAALAPPDVSDALTDVPTLTKAVQIGILDAPQLRNNPFGAGKITTRIDERGACIAVHPTKRQPISEEERLSRLGINLS
jgi:hypothetical protein